MVHALIVVMVVAVNRVTHIVVHAHKTTCLLICRHACMPPQIANLPTVLVLQDCAW
jgi:hypothetical protein